MASAKHKITSYVKIDSYKEYHYFVKYDGLFYGLGGDVTIRKLKKLIEYVKNGIVNGLNELPGDGWEKKDEIMVTL